MLDDELEREIENMTEYDHDLLAQRIKLIDKMETLFKGKKDKKGKLIKPETILDYIYNSKHHSQIHELLAYMEYVDKANMDEALISTRGDKEAFWDVRGVKFYIVSDTIHS